MAHFEVYQDNGNAYHWCLKVGDQEIIAVGQGCTTRASCLEGITQLKAAAPSATIFEV